MRLLFLRAPAIAFLRALTAALACGLCLGAVLSCAPAPPASAPCDGACQDGNALRALRETMKLVFNLTLQGKEVGHHDETVPCLRGGTAHIFGDATSNAEQGTTEVDLTYELASCSYLQKATEPRANFSMSFDGTVHQKGTLAVQPAATTAIVITSDAMSFKGTVYDPPIDYTADRCALDLLQNGSNVGGSMCDRKAGFSF
jgi:hypothetical protein